jgi:aminoglycoside phosphotransferase (APT) family kinase protein
MEELPGLNLAALSGWLDETSPGLRTGPLAATVIAGGKSNLTYRVSDEATNWAVRRPPLGHVLPTAHDMSREFRVIKALAPIGIPVPPPVALCPDPSVLGAPFYLMGFVDGVVVDTPSVVAGIQGDAAGRLGDELVDRLIDLHAVDPDGVGLGDLGRPVGFLQRQLTRWDRQWQASAVAPSSAQARALELLAGSVPPSGRPAIVHGDYRLGNVIFDRSLRSIAAIVDWEMATIADPLTDVGLLYVYQRLAEVGTSITVRTDPDAGYRTADELIARYAERGDRDVSALPWHIALGYFKLAVIAESIAARHRQGQTIGAGFDEVGTMVEPLLESSIAMHPAI